MYKNALLIGICAYILPAPTPISIRFPETPLAHYSNRREEWTSISSTDTNIRYIGRWRKDTIAGATVMEGMWSAPYFKAGLDGGSLKLVLDRPIDRMFVSIDDQPGVFYDKVEKEILLTPHPLSRGKHTIRVAGGNESDQLFVKELQVQEGRVIAPEIKPLLIEFVGNSITAGGGTINKSLTSYAWQAAELLHAENVRICTSGILLVTGNDFTKEWTIGMEDSYFKIQNRRRQDKNWYLSHAADWNFKDYQPDIIVINLGTNDRNEPAPHKDLFTYAYIRFLRNVRAKNPGAKIVILPTFLECNNNTLREMKPYIMKAVEGSQKMRMKDISLVDTEGWIDKTDLMDGLHPNDKGAGKIAHRLADALSASFNLLRQ
jgi:lysophospholipase L1-like esterase